MKIQHLRNATMILRFDAHSLLVDPMLSKPKSFIPFRLWGKNRRRNPLVPLPDESDQALKTVTGIILTHNHPDHFDSAGQDWAKTNKIPVWTDSRAVAKLKKKGQNARDLRTAGIGTVEVIPSTHGRGIMGKVLGRVVGYYIAPPHQPSIYLIGDSIMTDSVMDAISRLQPDIIVAPAGAANFGIGGDILFSVDELVVLAKHAPDSQIVFNHLEALDHCPTTRDGLRARMHEEGLSNQIHIPEDGEELEFN
ncbi:MAG: MBL fold metallo-hydrolase [Kofleriaceae bacterium]|nr:MBL fold metallo-hydrolase [Kofleriaceae bacterium]